MWPVLGLLGFGGLAWTVVRAARGPISPAEWVVLAWALPFFALTGGLYVKFPRYLLPLTPVLAAYAARGYFNRRATRVPPCPSVFIRAPFWACWPSCRPRCSPWPWWGPTADRTPGWRLPNGSGPTSPGAVIAVEEWDHPLPLDAEGYTLRALPVFEPEGEEKEQEMASVLAEADAVVIASRRGYGALARWPDRFPTTLSRYRALFSGERGFVAAGCWGRWPSLVGLSLADDPFGSANLPLPHPACRPAGVWLRLPRLDESFVVYDHPEVVVFVASR